MDWKLSAKEKQRRELILQREFANTTLSRELLSKTIASLRDMPTAPLIEPFGSQMPSDMKEGLYDVMTTSSYLQKHSEIVRAWFQFRMQDLIERGHLSSHIEIIFMNEVFGGELAGTITRKSLEILKDHDRETREYVVSPKNEIEAIIFEGLVGEGNANEKSTQL